MELAVQLFCIPPARDDPGAKSDSNELESNILEERTFLMRLDT